MKRFPFSADNSVYNDLLLLVLQTSKQYLDQRHPNHLCRLILSMHLMQKKILRSLTLSPEERHLEIKWFQTDLSFPFCSRRVHGLLIGFNVADRYEIFDEENILLALQKYLPDLRLVKDSFYCHTSPNKHVKIFYLEIEKKYGALISNEELNLLKTNLEQKVTKSIQTLSPAVSMWQTQEETYKNIIVLSNEITSLQDLPQVYIAFEKQTGKEIVFQIILVQISPFHSFDLKERFLDCTYISQRHLTVKSLNNHPIEGIIFSLYLPRTPDFLKSDGSLNFYAARKKVVDLLNAAIGEFRDYNGGIILKQHQQLQALKQLYQTSEELLENFIFSLSPLEHQVTLSPEKLSNFFEFFLENLHQTFEKSLNIFKKKCDDCLFLSINSKDSALMDVITSKLQGNISENNDLVYNFLHLSEGHFFNCMIMRPESREMTAFVQLLEICMDQWKIKQKQSQSISIGMEYSILSLDPRIGGDLISNYVQKLLFEGLTRFNQNGSIENAVAKSVSVSPCSKKYTFYLRRSFWNDGSPVTAYDFEYAWKKILSPKFKTSFAFTFYSIKNAREAKEGTVNENEIGIKVIDDLTLQIELINPTPYFLQLTALPLFSPVHHVIDQQHPQWPHQTAQNYPCNGPYQLTMNKPNQGYKFVKNPFYFESHQLNLEEITLTSMSPSQSYQAFKKNELDWIGNPLGSWQPFFKPGKDEQIVTVPNSTVCWLVFNTSKKPFNHIKMRQAFSYAIKRSEIISGALVPAFSPLIPGGKRSHALFPDFNPEIAKQYFDQALHELNMTKNDIEPIRLIFSEFGVQESTAIAIEKQFRECFGIQCEMVPLTWNNLFNDYANGDFNIGLVNWSTLIEDPVFILNVFKSNISNVNFPKWNNLNYNRVLDLSDQEANPYQRSYYLLEAEKMLSHEMPIVPLFYQSFQALVKNNLEISFKYPNGPFEFAKTKVGK